MPIEAPSRKNRPNTTFVRQEKTPFQVLMHLGIARHRAEKALAATGNSSAEKAMNWLVSHINDPRLDEATMREYALYAIPIGTFGEQLMNFWYDSRELCVWNAGHNRLPHVTIVSFFKAPAAAECEISKAVKTVVDELNAYVDKPIELKQQKNERFMGFFVDAPDDKFFQNIGEKYVETIKSINPEEKTEPTKCCPPLAQVTTQCVPRVKGFPLKNWRLHSKHSFLLSSSFGFIFENDSALDDDAELNKLHLTLALNYDKGDSVTLSTLFGRFENVDASSWELRLYSRDIRIGSKQVLRITHSYTAQAYDELNVNVGDFVVCNQQDEDGWIHGASITTGENGYFPANHSERVPESDTWSLHTRVHCIGSTKSQFLRDDPLLDFGKKRAETSLEDCARGAIDSDKKIVPWIPAVGKIIERPNFNQKLIIMRHAERVDYAFPRWTDHCFTELDGYERLDLNLPLTLPERRDGAYRYPWKFDPPITNIGANQAVLTGQMLNKQNVSIGFVYSSPAFRCIQTAQAVLQGLKADVAHVKIRIEPALYEWCRNSTEIPQFLTARELDAAGYNIDVGYVPLVSYEDLEKKFKGETLTKFYDRSHRVSDYAIKRSSENTLLVGHAANLETNSRLVLGGNPQSLDRVREIVSKVPYASLLALEKNDYLGKWVIAKPFMLPLSHSRNFQFDTRTFSDLYRSVTPRRN